MLETERKHIEERLAYGLAADLPEAVFHDRFNRCRKMMEREQIDALIIYSGYAEVLGREWSRYFVNYVPALFAEEALIIIPLKGEPTFLINAGWMIDVARKESPIIKDIRPLSTRRFTDVTRYQGTDEIISSILKDRGLENGRIGLGLWGMKGDYVPRSMYEVIQRGCARAKTVDVSAKLIELIQIKTPYDIEMIRKVVAINCEGIRACFEALGEGKPEYSGYLAFQAAIADRGVDLPPFYAYVWSGPSAELSLRPYWATARRLNKGDMYYIDPGICYKGYYSDLRRSAVIGRPNDEQKRVYEVALKALNRMVDKLRIGEKASVIADAWQDEIDKSGYEVPTPLMGHSVGIFCNEPPYIVPGSEAIIKENMVISLESLVHVPGGTGAPIEDTYLVTANGPERLSTDDQSLFIVE